MMKMTRTTLAILVLLSTFFTCAAQGVAPYQAKFTYDDTSQEVFDMLRDHINSETDKSEKNAEIRRINQQRLRFLKKLVAEKIFISDAKFEVCLQQIVNRIVMANGLEDRQRLILIARTPHVDASNYGRGIFVVTLGLLARVQNENELAFTLAHEIAHDEFGHVQLNVKRKAESNQDAMKESIGRIAEGKPEEEDIETIRNAVYQAGRFSRQKELDADSMAYVLFTKAGYDPDEGIKMFDLLKSPTGTKGDLGIEILLPLHTETYELQDHWFKERLSVYSKELTAPLGLSLDSLKSHPDLDLRKEKLTEHYPQSPTGSYRDSEMLIDVIHEAEIEMVEVCFQKRMYDRCLFYALQLLHRSPGDTYAVSRIGKIFVDLKNARDKLIFHQYMPTYTIRYGEYLKLVNTMLQNLQVNEIAELGYHFISNKNHFNPEDPSHYYIKWKLCDATYRYDEEKAVKKMFKEKFGTSPDFYTYK